MRVSTLFYTFLALQQFGQVLASHGRKIYTRPPTSVARTAGNPNLYPPVDPIASRQHHERRNLLDVCAYIDTDQILGGDILGIPLRDLAGLKICLCLSALPLGLEVDVQLQVLRNKYGEALIDAVLDILINTCPNSKHCSYPKHAQPGCSAKDPCGFSCEPPYVEQGGECVCPAPYVSCNGECGYFPKGCGSALPRAIYRRSTDSGTDSAQATCKPQESVCGVFGGRNHAFECINTASNLESCGGCMSPNPFVPYNASAPLGRDCTTVEGADSVACASGTCVVKSCASGWTISGMGEACVPTTEHTTSGLTMNADSLYSINRQRSRRALSPPVLPSEAQKDDESGPRKEGEHADYYGSAFYRN